MASCGSYSYTFLLEGNSVEGYTGLVEENPDIRAEGSSYLEAFRGLLSQLHVYDSLATDCQIVVKYRYTFTS
jgi:hypothetical protein